MSVMAEFVKLRPAGGFQLIMADPAWQFSTWSDKGLGKSADAHYGCTPLEWICGLPVRELAGPNCLLWLWATNPMLPQAIEVMSAWGFTFKTAGTWVKRTRHGKVGFGTGYILRSANEPFLIGTIGKPRTTRSTRSALVTGPDDGVGDDWPSNIFTIEGELRAHSQKPEAGYAACEALMPDAKRLELFSRTNRAGWSVWGNEVGKLGDVA